MAIFRGGKWPQGNCPSGIVFGANCPGGQISSGEIVGTPAVYISFYKFHKIR